MFLHNRYSAVYNVQYNYTVIIIYHILYALYTMQCMLAKYMQLYYCYYLAFPSVNYIRVPKVYSVFFIHLMLYSVYCIVYTHCIQSVRCIMYIVCYLHHVYLLCGTPSKRRHVVYIADYIVLRRGISNLNVLYKI